MTEEVVDLFFDKLQTVYDNCDILHHPQRLFNLDECGLNTDERSSSCFYSRGSKTTYILNPDGGKTSYSILVCGNAVGDFLPPL